jgi:hypothetical protein
MAKISYLYGKMSPGRDKCHAWRFVFRSIKLLSGLSFYHAPKAEYGGAVRRDPSGVS